MLDTMHERTHYKTMKIVLQLTVFAIHVKCNVLDNALIHRVSLPNGVMLRVVAVIQQYRHKRYLLYILHASAEATGQDSSWNADAAESRTA